MMSSKRFVTVGRIRRDAWKTMVESVPSAHRRIDGSAQVRQFGEVVLSLFHRESPRHTPDRPPLSHLYLWTLTVYAVDKHIRRPRRRSLHSPGHLFYVGIIVAGTPSYECPFQTPILMTLQSVLESHFPWGFITSATRICRPGVFYCLVLGPGSTGCTRTSVTK